MSKSGPGRVEKITFQLWQGNLADAQLGRGAIQRIAYHGMLQCIEVYTDLMRPPGGGLDVEEGGVSDICEGTPVRARVAGIRDGRSAPGLSLCGHARAVNGIASNRERDASALFLQDSLHQRNVGFLYRALAERFSQLGVGRIVLGHQNYSRRLFVQTMHDSRPQGIAA